MEYFIIFILSVCVIILFNNFARLKEDNEHFDSLIRKNREDYNALKNEIAEIKKQIANSGFTVVDIQ